MRVLSIRTPAGARRSDAAEAAEAAEAAAPAPSPRRPARRRLTRKQARNIAIAVPAALVFAAAAACGSAAGSGSSSGNSGSATGTTSLAPGAALGVTSSSNLGQIVINGKSLTVYRYDLDKVNSGMSNCTGSCASTWPPVTVTGSGMPKVSGVNQSLVGEISRAGGVKQLTLAGSPLYTYRGDPGPGSAAGQGFGGIWWAVTPTGAKASSGGGSSPSGGGGGGNY